MSSKFRIYPSIGIARLGNGEAEQDDVVFSPEVPWANLYDTDQNYLDPKGQLKKQAQRFYIYSCDESGKPAAKIDPNDYDIEWTAEVANKKPFWYDFNNSLDLSVQSDNLNLSPNFYNDQIAPGIDASYRNPNVLNQSLREEGAENYRKELVNSPAPVSVSASNSKNTIDGEFPFSGGSGVSQLAAAMDTTTKPVRLGTMEYDQGTLIFYGADGLSASLNPSDLNTDFADNSNWYDDICDGRITAKITNKATGEVTHLNDAASAAWIATAPPDYAPQIQPISTMYDLINGATEDSYGADFSLIFPVFYRLYRMQWVNLGDFLSPSFREMIDKIIADGNFKYLYSNDGSETGRIVREQIFYMFRDPQYNYNNEPIIPSKEDTDLENLGSGTEELKLPYYPGDGINYPGSPAQWFAIPPVLYNELKKWCKGDFPSLSGTYDNMDDLGKYYQNEFTQAAQDPAKSALLMTRAVLETLYGGGFHPGVELTWPLRHKQMYSENSLIYPDVTSQAGIFGLREIRFNIATEAEQQDIFYNDFGLQINAQDVAESMQPGNAKNWLWKTTPGDLTKWMGIPWQSDAGSCQAVFTDSQYPVPAWWAANLPVDVLTEESLAKIQDNSVLENTKQSLYANRLPWLKTTDTGFVGYHAEGGYLNGLINMVYQWKNIGVVTGRKSNVTVPGIPETLYVSFDSKNRRDKTSIYLGKAVSAQPAPPNPPNMFYSNTIDTVWIPEDKSLWLCSNPDGTGDFFVDDSVKLMVNGNEVYSHDFSNGCSGIVTPLNPTNVTQQFGIYQGTYVTLEITYSDLCGGGISSTNFYLVFK